MCGIVGVLNRREDPSTDERLLRRMLGTIRHRGPDEFGVYLYRGDDCTLGLGNARLSIIDLGGGQQPISNEDRTKWIVFNGEIFNYLELREGLLERGHRLATQSDTEVIIHLFEEFGPVTDCTILLDRCLQLQLSQVLRQLTVFEPVHLHGGERHGRQEDTH